MKYLAKHPEGAVYELTREEMETPSIVKQLKIDELWLVRVDDKWVPIAEFFGLPIDQFRGWVWKTMADTRETDAFLSPTAPWTPASVFCLALRLLGLYLLLQVFEGVLSLFTGLATSGSARVSMPQRFWVGSIFTFAFYTAAGIYLVLGPRPFVAWVFRNRGAVKEKKRDLGV